VSEVSVVFPGIKVQSGSIAQPGSNVPAGKVISEVSVVFHAIITQSGNIVPIGNCIPEEVVIQSGIMLSFGIIAQIDIEDISLIPGNCMPIGDRLLSQYISNHNSGHQSKSIIPFQDSGIS